MQKSIPQSAVTVTDWYKQNVYDPDDNKIGEVMDVLVDKSGKINTLIVGIGGFLGASKDVAVPFDAVEATMKDKKMWLVMNTTKDSLKSAPEFKLRQQLNKLKYRTTKCKFRKPEKPGLASGFSLFASPQFFDGTKRGVCAYHPRKRQVSFKRRLCHCLDGR